MPVAAATLTDGLKLVGEARLKVLFWSIYDSALYSKSGRYTGLEPRLTLEISYLRRIGGKQLLGRTREEWEKKSIEQNDIDNWLLLLESILPDVKRGEKLTLQVEDNLSSSFYFNGELIGNIENIDFTKAFLAIWLSEESSYPTLQAKLVGGK